MLIVADVRMNIEIWINLFIMSPYRELAPEPELGSSLYVTHRNQDGAADEMVFLHRPISLNSMAGLIAR
jgi:hypothetical protein